MLEELERVLFTEDQIRLRIKELAEEISRDYDGREVVLVTVLKGAVFFLTYLAPALTIPVRLDFLGIDAP